MSDNEGTGRRDERDERDERDKIQNLVVFNEVGSRGRPRGKETSS